jgi:hypothetical protein
MGRMIQRKYSRHAWTILFFEGDERWVLCGLRERERARMKIKDRGCGLRDRLWVERQAVG